MVGIVDNNEVHLKSFESEGVGKKKEEKSRILISSIYNFQELFRISYKYQEPSINFIRTAKYEPFSTIYNSSFLPK